MLAYGKVDIALEKMSEAINTTNTKVTALEAKGSEYKTTAVDLRRRLTVLEQRQQKEVMELKTDITAKT